MGNTPASNFLAHYGVKGMKWGKRKKSSSEPSSDDASKAADLKVRAKKSGTSVLTNQELQTLVTRMNLEQQYSRLNPQTKSAGRKFLEDAAPILAQTVGPKIIDATVSNSAYASTAKTALNLATSLAKKR